MLGNLIASSILCGFPARVCIYPTQIHTKLKKKKTRKVWFLFLRFSGPGNITNQMHMKRKLDDGGYTPTSRGLERKHLLCILGNI